MTERHQLQDRNAQLQQRLAEVFQQRASAEDTHRDEHVTDTADQQKRYLNYMGTNHCCCFVLEVLMAFVQSI